MGKLGQIIANLILYGFFVWLLYDSLAVEHDPWFAFCVAFVIAVAIVVQLMPRLHARGVSPGRFPDAESHG
jgi:hypothetical protein